MKQKDFKQLVQDKMLLNDERYDELFLALEKYGIKEEQIASQLPDNSTILNAALPSLTSVDAEGDYQTTKPLMERLDIDDTTAVLLVNWLYKYGQNVDNINQLPFGMGDQVNEAFDKIGINDITGPSFTREDISGSLCNALDNYAAENHVINDNTIAEPTDKTAIEDKIKEVGEKLNNFKFEYADEEGGFKLVGIGDKMYIYNCIEQGWSVEGKTCEPRLVATVDCPLHERAEFVSEFKEEAYNQSNYGFARDHKLAVLGMAVSKDIEEEHEFSTGNIVDDLKRDVLENKAENLEEKLATLQSALDNLEDNNTVFSSKMKAALENWVGDIQEELDETHKQLEIYEALEIENAKELKEKLEETQRGIEEHLAKLKEYEAKNPLVSTATKVEIEALNEALDEVQDRLRAIDKKLDDKDLEKGTNDLKPGLSIPKIKDPEIIPLPNHPYGEELKIEKMPFIIGKDETEIEYCVEKVQESVEIDARNAAPAAKEEFQACVVNIDNLITEFKDDAIEWGKKALENPYVQTAINGLKAACETEPHLKAAITVGEEIITSPAVQAAAEKVKEFAVDAYNHPGVQKFINGVKGFAEDIANNPYIQKIASDVKDVANDIVNSEPVQKVVKGAKELFGDVVDGAQDLYNSENVQNAIGAANEAVDNFVNHPKVQEFNKDAKEFVLGVHDKVETFVKSDEVQDALGKVKNSVEYGINEAKKFATNVANNPKVQEFVGNVKDFGNKAVAEGREFLQDVANHPTVQAAADGTKSFINGILAKIDVKEFVEDVKTFSDKVSDTVDNAVSKAKEIVNDIKEEVTKHVDNVKEAFDDAKSWVADKWNKFFGKEDDIELDIDD